jgi:F0F1-type ATP synthase assembly protein I
MTIGGLIVAAVLLIISRVTKKVWLKHFVFGGLTTWFAAYIFYYFAARFSASKERST